MLRGTRFSRGSPVCAKGGRQPARSSVAHPFTITTRQSRLAAVLLGNEAATAKAGRGSGPNGSRLGNVARHCAEVITA